MLSNWAVKKLEHLTLDYMKFDCKEGSCYGVIGVSHKDIKRNTQHSPTHRFTEYPLPWSCSMLSSVAY